MNRLQGTLPVRSAHAAYRHIDLRLASRIGGALALIGLLFAAALLPFSPPSGTGGWVGVGVCGAITAWMGWAGLRGRGPHDAGRMLASTYVLAGCATAAGCLTGTWPGYGNLLMLTMLYAAVMHPPRRAAGVLAAGVVLVPVPLLVLGAPAAVWARTIGEGLLWTGLGAVGIIWSRRVYALRAELHEARRAADALARADALTGLGNRRALEEVLRREIARAERRRAPLSVLVGDLEGFKAINDRHGHPAGDRCLRAVADALRGAVRIPDICFRWGGDEFVVVLADCDGAQARAVAARAAAAIAATCADPAGVPLRLTLGAGEHVPGHDADALLASGDAALLAARRPRRAAEAVPPAPQARAA